MSAQTHTGSCLCGALKVAAEGEPDHVAICHCKMCARHTGAPFVQLIVFPGDRVTITGETYGYLSSERVDRRGCKKCGAPVYIVATETGFVELYAGAMDNPHVFVPEYEIFDVHRPRWLPKIAGVPTYEGRKP